MEITLNLKELKQLKLELELLEKEFNEACINSDVDCLFSILEIGTQEAICKLKRKD